MSDIGRQGAVPIGPTSAISTIGYESLGYNINTGMNQAFTGSTGTVAGQGYFYPFVLNETVSVTGFGWVNPAAVSGNTDAAIYDYLGNRVCTAGNPATTGTTAAQLTSITPVTVQPGWYYLAFSSSASLGFTEITLTNFWRIMAAAGFGIVASGANPLPSTATIAVPAASFPLYWVVAFIVPTF